MENLNQSRTLAKVFYLFLFFTFSWKQGSKLCGREMNSIKDPLMKIVCLVF